MVRISGIDLPSEKRIDIALTYLYGIGRSNVGRILKEAKIPENKRVHTLTDDEVSQISRIIDKGYQVEGDLRRLVSENVKRLRDIGAYRGVRHAKGLPSRGQRTRSNARTKRGRRVTIGAIKKDDKAKMSDKAPDSKK